MANARRGNEPGKSESTRSPLTDGTVLLRLPRDSDIAAVFDYGQDLDIEETAWLPIPAPCPYEVARCVVGEFKQGWNGRFGFTFVISDPTGDEFLGVIMLARHGTDIGEISYGMAPRHRNRGFATRAAKLVAGWAFDHLGLKRVEIRAGIQNVASQRVAEKANFSREGVVRARIPATGEEYDDVVYASLADVAHQD